jgi:hypothetical protein
MSKDTTVFLPAGKILTITTDSVNTATYTRLGNPGAANGSPVSIPVSSTIVIGGFVDPYTYLLSVSSNLNGLTYTVTNGFVAADSAIRSLIGNGAASQNSVTAVEYGDGVIHRTVLTCTATTITISDDAGVAQYGGIKVYDFPEGLIKFDGAVITGTLTGGVTGTITNTFAGGVALGTATATTGATLTGTEATYLPENDVAAATSKVATIAAYPSPTALTESGARWVDGTGTAADLYLNFVIDDDATHTAGTATFTGTISFNWQNLGDL